MKYSIRFIGVSRDKCTNNADAIIINWKDEKQEKIVLFDTGYKAHGEKIVEVLKNEYFSNTKNNIDSIIVSHYDKDHIGGAKYILENVNVEKLYINQPWNLTLENNDEDLTEKMQQEYFHSLKESYNDAFEIIKLAECKGTKVFDAYQNISIDGRLFVASPSKKMVYEAACTSNESIDSELDLICENENSNVDINGLLINPKTTKINESSIVIVGNMIDEQFILTADAGQDGLNNAINCIKENGIDIEGLKLVQIPHHGSKENLTSEIFTYLFSNKPIAIISLAQDKNPDEKILDICKKNDIRVERTKGEDFKYSN